MNEWIDISQPLSNSLAVYPGDTRFQYKLAVSKDDTNPANIGDITMSLHNGTHIDAPFHFNYNGATIDELPIELFIGTAIVIDVSSTNIINESFLQQFDLKGISRVLLHTSLANDPHHFPETFPYIHPDIAIYLKEHGVRLLGVDLPSVDPMDSSDLPTHHALNNVNIHILENLMLDDITPGVYEFFALPLLIEGADASPVRAVIRKTNQI